MTPYQQSYNGFMRYYHKYGGLIMFEKIKNFINNILQKIEQFFLKVGDFFVKIGVKIKNIFKKNTEQ